MPSPVSRGAYGFGFVILLAFASIVLLTTNSNIDGVRYMFWGAEGVSLTKEISAVIVSIANGSTHLSAARYASATHFPPSPAADLDEEGSQASLPTHEDTFEVISPSSAYDANSSDPLVMGFHNDSTQRLINHIKGKRYLVVQIDNRVLKSKHQLGHFNVSVFGPSLLSMHRWAERQNLAYLLYVPPALAVDALNHQQLCKYWFKPAALVFIHRLAQLAGLDGVLYADSDVCPSYYAKINTTSHPALVNPATALENPTDVQTLERFLTRTVGDTIEDVHFIVPPGHSAAKRWLYSRLRFWDDTPVINAGVLFFRATPEVGNALTYWFVNMTHNVSRMEVSKARGKFIIKNHAAIGRIKRWPRNTFDTARDLFDDSICSPWVEVDPRVDTGELGCRGTNGTMLMDVWNQFCRAFVGEVVCTLPPEIKSQLDQCWPGDQSRLQDLVIRDWTRNNPNVNPFKYSLDKDWMWTKSSGIPDSSRSIFRVPQDPRLSGEGFTAHRNAKRTLFHWGPGKEKRRASIQLSGLLKAENNIDMSSDKWELDESWRLVAQLPMFRFPEWTDNLVFTDKQAHLFSNDGELEYLNI